MAPLQRLIVKKVKSKQKSRDIRCIFQINRHWDRVEFMPGSEGFFSTTTPRRVRVLLKKMKQENMPANHIQWEIKDAGIFLSENGEGAGPWKPFSKVWIHIKERK